MTTAIQPTWKEGDIARVIHEKILERKCLAVVDRCSWTGHECDLLAVTLDRRVIDVEIKISRADFKADRKKDKWWNARIGTGSRDGPNRQWPIKVWKHYYAIPADVWNDSLLDFMPSDTCGLLLLHALRYDDGIGVECRRRAKPNRDAYRLTETECVAVARLASLRMWTAYQQRDAAMKQAADLRAQRSL